MANQTTPAIQIKDSNVGIGTVTPAQKLHVDGTVITTSTLNSTAGSYSIDHPGTQTWKIGITNTNTSTFHIGNDAGGSFANKIFNITDAGNVGIGTTSPNHLLSISSTSTGGSVFGLYNTVSNTDNRNWALKLNASSYGDLGFFVSSTNGGNPESGTIAMLINKAGEVAVGTSTPLLTTSGRGNITINGSSASILTLAAGGTWKTYLYTDGTNTDLSSANALIFGTNGGTERMRIASNGALKFNAYGSGTFTGTTAYNLAVDSSGNIIESTPLTNPVTGTGVDNRVAIWSGTTTQDSSANLTFDGSYLYLAGTLQFPQNPVGTTYGNGVSATPPYGLYQSAGDSDAIRLYAESPYTNQVSMVFEVNDDIEANGSEWIWRNKQTYSSYTATTPMSLSGTGNLTTTGNATFGQGAARPVTYDSSGGNFKITANVGGWATGYFFNGSAGTYKGGFGGFGSSDSLTYHWIGDDYNTPTMVLKPSQGNVGIGTTDPGSKLEIAGALGGTVGVGGSTIKLTNTDTGNYASVTAGITGVTNDGMQFSTDGTARMVISTSGYIGIGTTSPSQKLEVNGRALVNQFQYTKAVNYSSGDLNSLIIAGFYDGSSLSNAPLGNSGWFYITVETYSGDNNWIHQTATTFGSGNTANEVYTRVRAGGTWGAWKKLSDSGDISGTTNYIPKFTGTNSIGDSVIYDNSGLVGIGITSANAKLHIAAAALGTSTGNSVLNSIHYNPNSNAEELEIKSVRTSAGSDWTTSGKRIQLRIDSTYMGYMQFNGTGNQAGISFGTGTTTTGPGNVTERMRINSSGNVGIGTDNPGAKLHTVIGSDGTALILDGTNASDRMYFGFDGTGTYLEANGSTSARKKLRLQVESGGGYTQLYIDAANDKIYTSNSTNVGIGTSSPGSYKLNVNGDTNVIGTLTATVKSFIIDHPTKEGKKLQYGVLEGPEHSVYVRGKLTNTNVIQLPDYWHALVHEDSITVNLTAIGKPQEIWVEEITDTYITVGSSNLNVNCFYTVFAERKDIDKLVTEFDKQ